MGKKLWYIHTVGYCAATQKEYTDTTQMNLTDIMGNNRARCKRRHAVSVYIYLFMSLDTIGP